MDSHTVADRDFHNATAHLYDSNLEPIFGPYHELAVAPLLDELVELAPGTVAADIGCGTGALTVAMAKRGLLVTGVDHSKGMLGIARTKVELEVPESRVELIEGDIRSLPFDDGELDVIGCQGVLHHLEDIPAMVAEFARVLVPGGVAYVAEPCEGSNLGLRIWPRIGHRLHRPPPEPEEAADLDVPDHDEGPIDPVELLEALPRNGLRPRVEYWSQYVGLERLPKPLYKAALRGFTKPWRNRSGNLMFVLATKEGDGVG